MSEWQVQPAQARKERQANKRPAWRVAADHAWERSGARFMMQQCDLGVLRHRRDSCPSHDDVGGFFFDFEAIRTALTKMLRAGSPRRRTRRPTYCWSY